VKLKAVKLKAESGAFGCWRFEVGGKEAQGSEAQSSKQKSSRLKVQS
jgi:hypothetical protein